MFWSINPCAYGRENRMMEKEGYYRATWEACLRCDPDFIVMNSYNECGESSVIESARQFGKDYLEYTREYVEAYKQRGD